VKLERTSMEGAAESGDELAAEDAAEQADGKEEGSLGGDQLERSGARPPAASTQWTWDETVGADSSYGAR